MDRNFRFMLWNYMVCRLELKPDYAVWEKYLELGGLTGSRMPHTS